MHTNCAAVVLHYWVARCSVCIHATWERQAMLATPGSSPLNHSWQRPTPTPVFSISKSPPPHTRVHARALARARAHTHTTTTTRPRTDGLLPSVVLCPPMVHCCFRPAPALGRQRASARRRRAAASTWSTHRASSPPPAATSCRSTSSGTRGRMAGLTSRREQPAVAACLAGAPWGAPGIVSVDSQLPGCGVAHAVRQAWISVWRNSLCMCRYSPCMSLCCRALLDPACAGLPARRTSGTSSPM